MGNNRQIIYIILHLSSARIIIISYNINYKSHLPLIKRLQKCFLKESCPTNLSPLRAVSVKTDTPSEREKRNSFNLHMISPNGHSS